MPSGVFSLKQQVAAIRQGAWTNQPPTAVNYLVVAGGGSGGGHAGGAGSSGGGGAGGLLAGVAGVVAGSSITVTIGAGGSAPASTYPSPSGNNGSNSVFGSITATGGGAGGTDNYGSTKSGSSGGSGGGAGWGGTYAGSAGISGQGNAGGSSTSNNASPYSSCGGGGAGTVGLGVANGGGPGNGGAGIASDISGTRTTYAGGGGGGSNSSSGSGGAGGGGAGGSGANGTSGSANTGGGGGGAGNSGSGLVPGSGGSGIVIVSYPGTTQWFTGGTVYYANGNVVHVFTSSGTLAPTTATPANSSCTISRSLRFNSADSAYLSRTPASASNRQTWTISMWVKRGDLSAATRGLFGAGSASATDTGIYWTSGDKIDFFDRSGGTLQGYITTTAVFRDPSAWYHLVFVFDSTNATAANRMLIYVNNVLQGVTVNNTLPQNTNSSVNNTVGQNLGSLASASNFGNGYMTEVNFIDGQALTPSSFGETSNFTGVWVPKAYTGTYGTNGFYVNFSDNSNTTAATLGKDYSGNGNNWTPNNFSVTAGAGNDSLVDSPTAYGFDTGVGGDVRGNYATMNPLSIVANASLSNGNLDATNTSGSNYRTFVSTIAIPYGSWYCEFTAGANTSSDNMLVGICPASAALSSTYIGSSATSYAYSSNGTKYNNASATAYGASFTNGDVIGVAFNGSTLTFYKNGVSQGNAFTSLSDDFVFALSLWGTAVCTANFGQRPFAYTAPSGYKALCTQNLLTPAVVQGDDYFNTVLWTGNGSTPRNITGVGFQPDLVWIKERSAADDHIVSDSVRGTDGSTYYRLFTNSTSAESVNSQNTVITLNSDGFSIGSGPSVNNSADTYVAWNWKANGAGSTNTAGSITSTVSANQTSGFSVVTWTGTGAGSATVGHGLGVAPSFFIIKQRGSADGLYNWNCYHTSLGKAAYIALNTTGAAVTSDIYIWSNTAPTSSVITLGSSTSSYANINNYNGTGYVAYCFAAISGYSAFGSYTGNGADDGPFIYTGFRAAWILVKRSSSSGEGWWIYDNKRSPYNIANVILSPDSSGAEISGGTYPIDINSNGFKIRGINALLNTSAATYIYAAFAENPFKYALAR